MIITLTVILLCFSPQQNDYFIYGDITTKENNFSGRISWVKNKNLWSDKLILYIDKKTNKSFSKNNDNKTFSSNILKFFGFKPKINSKSDYSTNKIPFNYIHKIERKKLNLFQVTLINNDIMTGEIKYTEFDKLVLYSDNNDRININLNKISKITFSSESKSKSTLKPLYGKVYSNSDNFTGYIKWDNDEQLMNDKLNGINTENEKVKLLFSSISSIEKMDQYTSKITLVNTKTIILSDNNDIDFRNNGIKIYNEKLGDINIPWGIFKKVEFFHSNIPKYTREKLINSISGSIFSITDDVYSGVITYNLKQKYSFESVEGLYNEIKFNIQFRNILKISPISVYSSEITLRTNDIITLTDSRDVNNENLGVKISNKANQQKIIDWSNIKSIIFY